MVLHYALHELHILPGQFLALPKAEQAFIFASIDERIIAEKKSEEKMKRNSRGR